MPGLRAEEFAGVDQPFQIDMERSDSAYDSEVLKIWCSCACY